MKRVIVLLILTMGIGGCELGRLTDDTASALAALETMQAGVLDAVVKKDPNPVLALLGDDVVVHAPDGLAIDGKEGVASRIAALMPRVQAYSLNSRHLEASGDIAYDDAAFKLTLAGVDGAEPQELIGSIVLVLERQPDRTWRVIEAGTWLDMPSEMNHDMPGMAR